MSTETQTQITEAQVVSFLFRKQAELRAATGVKYAAIRLDVCGRQDVTATRWSTYVDGGDWLDGATVDAAIAAEVALVAPDNCAARAKNLRACAAALLAKAEEVEGGK